MNYGISIENVYGVKSSSTFLLCVFKSFVMFMVCIGTVTGFCDAFSLEYDKASLIIYTLLASMIMGLALYRKNAIFISFPILTGIFVLCLKKLCIHVTFGLTFIWEAVQDFYGEYLKMSFVDEGEYLSEEVGKKEAITVTLAFIATILLMLYCITIVRYMSFTETFVISFIILIIPLYIGCKPGIFSIILLMAGFICIGMLHYESYGSIRIPLLKKADFIRGKHFGRTTFTTVGNYIGVFFVLCFSILISVVIGLSFRSEYNEKIDTVPRDSVKEKLDFKIKEISRNGLEAIFYTDTVSSGIENGVLGKVSSINHNLSTDLVVSFVPYSTKTVYLPGFKGIQYTGSSWESSVNIKDFPELNIHGVDKIDSDAFDGIDKSLMRYMTIYDSVFAKMQISYVDSNMEVKVLPYYTLDVGWPSEKFYQPEKEDGQEDDNIWTREVTYYPIDFVKYHQSKEEAYKDMSNDTGLYDYLSSILDGSWSLGHGSELYYSQYIDDICTKVPEGLGKYLDGFIKEHEYFGLDKTKLENNKTDRYNYDFGEVNVFGDIDFDGSYVYIANGYRDSFDSRISFYYSDYHISDPEFYEEFYNYLLYYGYRTDIHYSINDVGNIGSAKVYVFYPDSEEVDNGIYSDSAVDNDSNLDFWGVDNAIDSESVTDNAISDSAVRSGELNVGYESQIYDSGIGNVIISGSQTYNSEIGNSVISEPRIYNSKIGSVTIFKPHTYLGIENVTISESQTYSGTQKVITSGSQTSSKIREKEKVIEEIEEINDLRLAACEAIKEMFDKEYAYTLSPGKTPENWDFVEYFLSEQKRGICTHFATAAVMLLRQMGIPARYREGYCIPNSLMNKSAVELDVNGNEWFSGENDYNPENKMYSVEVSDYYAHAWIEVYLENKGFVPFEVTPQSYETSSFVPQMPDLSKYIPKAKEKTDSEVNSKPSATPSPSPSPTPSPSVSPDDEKKDKTSEKKDDGNEKKENKEEKDEGKKTDKKDDDKEDSYLWSLLKPLVIGSGIVLILQLLFIVFGFLFKKIRYAVFLRSGRFRSLIYIRYCSLVKKLHKKRIVETDNLLPMELCKLLSEYSVRMEKGKKKNDRKRIIKDSEKENIDNNTIYDEQKNTDGYKSDYENVKMDSYALDNEKELYDNIYAQYLKVFRYIEKVLYSDFKTNAAEYQEITNRFWRHPLFSYIR